MNPKSTFIGLVVAALTTAGIFAVPADASGPPQIDHGMSRCWQTAYPDTNKDGQLRFECDYDVTGGTGKVTAAYYTVGGGGMASAYYGANYDFFEYTGLCYASSPITITARFTDTIGAQDSETDVVDCTDLP